MPRRKEYSGTGSPAIVLALRDGRSIRALRHHYGLTSEALGELLGVSGRRVRQLEESPKVKPEFARRVLDVLDRAVIDDVMASKAR